MEILYFLGLVLLVSFFFGIRFVNRALSTPYGCPDVLRQAEIIAFGADVVQKQDEVKRKAEEKFRIECSLELQKIDECAKILAKAREALSAKFGEDMIIKKNDHEISKHDFDEAWRKAVDLVEAKYGFYIVYDARAQLHLI